MYLVFSCLAWFAVSFILLGGGAEPLAVMSFTILYFFFFGVWGILWIFLSELITRRSGRRWPYLSYALLVSLLYVFGYAVMENVPLEVSLPFVPVIILYLIKLWNLGSRVPQ